MLGKVNHVVNQHQCCHIGQVFVMLHFYAILPKDLKSSVQGNQMQCSIETKGFALQTYRCINY